MTRHAPRLAVAVAVTAAVTAAVTLGWLTAARSGNQADALTVLDVAPGQEISYLALRYTNIGPGPERVSALTPRGVSAQAVTVSDVIVLAPAPESLPDLEPHWPAKAIPAGISHPPGDYDIPSGGTVAFAVRLSLNAADTATIVGWDVTIEGAGGRRTVPLAGTLALGR